MDIILRLMDEYKRLVTQHHGDRVHLWPVLTGYNRHVGASGSYLVVILRHTGVAAMSMTDIITPQRMSQMTSGVTIDGSNNESIRDIIRKSMALVPIDLVFLLKNNTPLPAEIDNKPLDLSFNTDMIARELNVALSQHEVATGIAPMKIFLSHKGVDKGMAREFKQTLQMLGFSPWLDEDAMPAGTSLERGILQGFDESCAAIFLITPNFVDENYLATEVEYAIHQKRSKGDKFRIITLVFNDGKNKIAPPRLLRPYVWKEPSSLLEGLREVLIALPIRVGEVRWKV